jgi:hypothetical protein
MASKLTAANIDACLAALTTALGSTSILHFFINQPAISRDSVVGNFTNTTAVGIAVGGAVATWSAPYTDPLTNLRTVCGVNQTFIASAVTAEENLNGWYLTDAMGTTLEGAGYFDQPVPISAVGQGITYGPCFDQRSFC